MTDTAIIKIRKRRLQWFGHVPRMGEGRRPLITLRCNIVENRSRGWQAKRWINNIKKIQETNSELRRNDAYDKHEKPGVISLQTKRHRTDDGRHRISRSRKYLIPIKYISVQCICDYTCRFFPPYMLSCTVGTIA